MIKIKRKMFPKARCCRWNNPERAIARKRKTKIKNEKILGSISISFVVVLFVALAGIIYIYSINSSAVKGYKIRQAENEIKGLKKESEQLKIREAELKSLYYIEEASKEMNMNELRDISFIDEASPVALR